MKASKLKTSLVVLSCFCCIQMTPQSAVNVNLYRHKGGPITNVSFILKSTKDSTKHQGIPVELDLYKIQEICFNRQQKDFEQFQDGVIDEKEYKNSLLINKSRDTMIVSNLRYKHTVYVLVGFNTAGKKVVIFDKNQNLDFADDHKFEFDTAFFSLSLSARDEIEDNLPEIELNYEHFDGHNLTVQSAMLKFDPYRIIRLNREKEELEKLLELRVIQNEYLEGSFKINERKYKILIANKLPNAATYINHFITMRVVPYLSSYDGTETFKRGDSLMLDGNFLLLNGPSMYGDSMKITNFGNMTKPYGSQVGFYARDMTFLYTDNTSQRLSDLLRDEKHVILDFWGTWCQPCIKQIPEVQKLYARIAELKDVKMVSIAYDDEIEKVHKILEQYNITWSNAFDDSSLENNFSSPSMKLSVTSFPALFLIQPDGKIISRNFGEIVKWVDQKLTEK
jgi:thiol-disulfide isomerase/thioredoxin